MSPRSKNAIRPPCRIGGCDAPQLARGWCSKHYQRWWSTGDARTEPEVLNAARRVKVCRAKGCRRKTQAKGYCSKHYQRFKRWGDPEYTVYTHDAEYATEVARRANAARITPVVPPPKRTDGRKHGTSGTYGIGCRCDACRTAERDRKRRRRERLRAERDGLRSALDRLDAIGSEVVPASAALLSSQSQRSIPSDVLDMAAELADLIAEQERDDRTSRVGYGASIDYLAENGIEVAEFDREDDEYAYRAAHSRTGVRRSNA